MKNISHYLYQYPQSKNYYFRFRIPEKYKLLLTKDKKHFTSTLKTSDINVAQYLAIFIKSKIFRELSQLEAKPEQHYQSENWDFYQYLKTKFDTYLSWGKKLSASQSFSEEIDQLNEVSTSDMNVYEDYLETLINDKDKEAMLQLNTQIAHAPYMLSYLGDYSAFLSSSFHTDIHKRSANKMPISKPNEAELFFNEQHYDKEFYQSFQEKTDVGYPVELKRFMARHAFIELEFKQHLIKQLKGFKQSYNPFTDTVIAQDYSPTEYGSFLEIIETLKETQKVLKEYKQEKEDKQAKKLVVPLKETFEQFIKEKAKSVKPEAVRLYKISINFLCKQLGEEYDITQFNRKKAIEIKEAVCRIETNRKSADGNSELAVKTVNRYIVNYGAFFNWCYEHSKISQNELFKNLKLKETKSSSNRHRPYTPEEVNKLWNYSFNRKNEAEKIRNDARLYIKVGIFTAMRLNEIADLTTDNFKSENGIAYISLIGNDVKTESSERKIPLHKELINIGLLDLVQKRKEEKQHYIFPQLRKGKTSPGKNGWGEPVSKWLNERLLRNIGIDKAKERENGKLVDFHSLRTTFLSECKHLGFSRYLVTQFAGHLRQDDITFDLYGSEVSTKLSVMKEMIDRVDLRKVDQ